MALQLTKVRTAQGFAMALVMYVAIHLALYLGVEEKTYWARFWDILTGGGLGFIASLVFFTVFGAIGWVSGAIFGAVGLLGLAAGGALGGLGLGALINVVRDPERYEIDFITIVVVLSVGALIAWRLAKFVGQRLQPLTEPHIDA